MKSTTVQTLSPFRKSLLLGIFLFSGIIFSNYKASACSASFTYTVGLNGHYSFTSTSVGGTQYSWNAGDGSGWHNAGINFNHVYLANGTYSAMLAISDSTFCIDTTTVSITVTNVTSPCILSANYTYTIAPYGYVNYTSTSTGTNAYTQYYWTPGDSNQRVRGTTTFSHQYAHPGYYIAWLTTVDTGGGYCIDSIGQGVDVTSVDTAYCHIHANFTYTVGVNGLVSFTSTSTGTSPTDRWFWNPGDTTSEGYTANTYSHTYLYDGTYNVMLDIRTDSTGGCYDSIVVPVTVTGACNLAANFSSVDDTTLPAVGKVFFTSTSAGTNSNTIYKWTFGDSTATVFGHDTISHDYPFIGYYYVTLEDSNIGGCTSSITKLIYVDNRDSLQACFTYMSDSLSPAQYDFTSCSRGTNANTYYKWTPGDGDPSDSGLGMNTYQHTYSHNGPYSATLAIWYTILPHRAGSSPRYDFSTVTENVNVTSVPTGIQSTTDSKIYNVYPNPNDGSFKIDVNGLANQKNAEIRISNMMGQLIYQSNSTVSGGNTLSDISLPNAASGVYLLQIITNDNTYTTRISIQK